MQTWSAPGPPAARSAAAAAAAPSPPLVAAVFLAPLALDLGSAAAALSLGASFRHSRSAAAGSAACRTA